ncbi:MAG TPA: hypothetical protein VNG69_15465 [Casimicrobiaceae bacterium]|nr:hypothetical protein [Casimicrobiaceae bacterium]
MTSRLALAACCIVALGACALGPIVPGKRHEVRKQPLSAFEAHEACVKMVPGDRLEYSFRAEHPVNFNIHYHEGKVVVAPVNRDKTMADSGAFEPLTAQDYCLMWEAGPIDTLFEYSVLLTPATKR